MEAISKVSQDLRRRENPRRLAVVIASEGAELSDRHSPEVVGDVPASDVVLVAYVIMKGWGAVRADTGAVTRDGRTTFPVLPDQNAAERAAALDEATKLTGGRHEHLDTSMVLVARLRELAAEFNNQYRVIYEGPRPAVISRSSIEVHTRRPDLRVLATRIPPN